MTEPMDPSVGAATADREVVTGHPEEVIDVVAEAIAESLRHVALFHIRFDTGKLRAAAVEIATVAVNAAEPLIRAAAEPANGLRPTARCTAGPGKKSRQPISTEGDVNG